MAHIAQQVRLAAATRLTGLNTTGSRVYMNRTDATPLHDSEFPGLIVSGGGEDVSTADLSAGIVQRDMRLRVSAKVKLTDDVEDQIDQIRSEVEIALATPLTIGPGTVRLLYTGMSDPETDENLDMTIMSVDLNFAYTVFTSRDAPDLQL